MSYLIDTNIIAEVRKGSRCDDPGRPLVGAGRRCGSVPECAGARRDPHRRCRDPVKAAALERWLDAVNHAFVERILPIDQAVADAWGRLNAPHPRPTVDSLLAATAQVYDLTLVTRNLAHVKHAGIKLLNPFAAE